MAPTRDLSDTYVMGGVVNKFALQFELGWKTLREALLLEGVDAAQSGSPRRAIKEAFVLYPFMDGALWIDMLEDRNRITHLYDEAATLELCRRIVERYIDEFTAVENGLRSLYTDSNDDGAQST